MQRQSGVLKEEAPAFVAPLATDNLIPPSLSTPHDSDSVSSASMRLVEEFAG